MTDGDLAGRAVVVTGGSRGIGAAAAAAFQRQGARVFSLARSDPGIAGVRHVACDVSDPGSVDAAFGSVLKETDDVDVLINNAGVIDPIGPLNEVPPDTWRNLLRVNVEGPFLCVRAVLPGMIRAGRGTVIQISSGAASNAMEGWSAYCVSKAALAMFTRMLHLEYGEAGIASIGFRPGMVDTSMQSQIRASGINRVSRVPREELLPVDTVAKALLWLASEDGRRYGGEEVSIHDQEFRRAAALA